MRTKKMGKKPEKIQGKAPATGQGQIQEGERVGAAGAESGADGPNCAAATWGDLATLGDEGRSCSSTS